MNDYSDIEIAEFPAGNHGSIKVRLCRKVGGMPKIDLRLFTPSSDGRQLQPSKRGIRIPAAMSGELIAALRKAEALADDLGCTDE